MEDNQEVASQTISDLDVWNNYQRVNENAIKIRWSALADARSGNRELEECWLEVIRELFSLWQDRQRKYGTGNIAAFMEVGCLVRSSDKVARLKEALLGNQGGNSSDESVLDSWMDLANYAIMGVICHQGKWPRGDA